jgi:hypothetical protein
VRIRASIIILTTFAATIPFLNQDSWQLVAGLEWSGICAAAGLTYFFPIVLLTFSQWKLILRGLYSEGWKPDEKLDLSSLLDECQAVGVQIDDTIKKCIAAGLEVAEVTKSEAVSVTVKNLIKLALFLTLFPLAVFGFVLLFFRSIISDKVLAYWLEGLFLPQSLVFFGISMDPLMVLRIKAAMLLAFLSAGVTLATLLASEDKMQAFISYAFARDIHQDKCLLILHRILQLATTNSLEEPQ